MSRLSPLVLALLATAFVACSGDGGTQSDTDTAIGADTAKTDTTTGTDGGADATEDVETCETLGDKVIGAECASHCECDTGYCYDEAYMAPFRFCTRPCDGGCNPPDGGDTHLCLNMTGALQKKHDLKYPNICQRRCFSADDCGDLSDQYDICGTGGFTKWENNTIGGRSCQISTLID